MASCTSFISSFSDELTANSSFFSILIGLIVAFMVVLYVLSRMNPSNRKLALLFQDVFRNSLISAFMIIFTPAILSLFCLTFTSLLGLSSDNAFSEMVDIGQQFIVFLENSIIMQIRNYREAAITNYGPNSIVYQQVNNFGSGTLILPQKQAPINSLFLKTANDAIGGLNTILVSIAIQRFLIDIFTSTDLFYIAMILALMIRIIPGFRDVGDFMYSLSIALFIILPFLYSLFTYPFFDNPSTFDFCSDIQSKLNDLLNSSGFSFRFLTPVSCYDLSFIETYTIYAIFLPNLIYGLTFSFASNFKKIFDVFQVGG